MQLENRFLTSKDCGNTSPPYVGQNKIVLLETGCLWMDFWSEVRMVNSSSLEAETHFLHFCIFGDEIGPRHYYHWKLIVKT
jgi:hypothetical protein